MGLNVVRGIQSHCLLADTAFLAEWAALQRECSWATPFQSPAFAGEWYSIYREPFEPVLIVSRDTSGRLNGLLPLARCRADGKLVAAGSIQAEYQTWICLPELATSFPGEAFDLLRQEFPSACLRLRYLPARTPLGFLSILRYGKTTLLEDRRRPLMTLGDGTAVEESFRKSGNKNRLRQLKRTGPIEFKRVTDPGEFADLLEEVTSYHDCRQLASYGSTPFLTDCRKKLFHLAMMNTPGLLHITVLKVGGRIASAHLNIINGKEVQLFLIAHSPAFARYSPGKLHVLFLARMLKEAGCEQLDLTPGGDVYKERFATAADEVHTLTLFPDASKKIRGLARAHCENLARAALNAASINPLRLRSLAWKFGDLGAAGMARRLASFGLDWTRSLAETRIYAYPTARARTLQVAGGVRRDSITDLLGYKPNGLGLSRQEFMADATARFEDGQHVYTYAEGGRLLVFGWLAEDATEGAMREVALPPKSAMVLEFQTCAETLHRDLSSLALRTMLRDAGRVDNLQTIFIALPGGDLSALDLVRGVGFTYQASIFRRTRFGRTHSWSQLAPRVSERSTESMTSNPSESDNEPRALQWVRPSTASKPVEAISRQGVRSLPTADRRPSLIHK